MSLGKLPVLKNLVSNSHSKRRFKSELTPDMISSPLGDFRHTMHVGRGGDVFGDTSFLSDHGGEKARETAKSNPLVRALRNVRKSPMRSRNSSREISPPPAVSPIIKNAVSLPHLLETKNGSVERLNFKSVVSSPGVMDGSYGLESGFCTLPRWSRLDKPKESPAAAKSEKRMDDLDTADFELPRNDSLLSFSLDLGPSLMAEVLGVMAKESPESPAKAASPVTFDLGGSFGQAAPQGNDSSRGKGERGLSVAAWKGTYQQKGGADLHPEDLNGLRGLQDFTSERHVLRHCGGAISYPDSNDVGGTRGGAGGSLRAGTRQPAQREAVGAREGSPPTDSGVPGRHLVTVPSTESWRYRAAEEADSISSSSSSPGSWRKPSSTGQRVPADGEERGEVYGEEYRERRLSPAQGMAFSPLKTEAFAFADEDDEIRV
ncbi:cdc42 effector protein 1-like [Hemiscyllium ocellatum]|uniref:cdc42 effector protein 1-like n=1 Tax=Hemiscyllium ocellatum TaxID=170820 RepID=UPI002965E696|nr:cdc42 effector protein 1-like [Hemiscyllium ocellatum]XP_060705691.1 cdc42 effector protein 1-like [Hemiscyllium ocellatum]